MKLIILEKIIEKIFLSKLGPKTKEDEMEVLNCCKGCEYLHPKLYYCKGEDSIIGVERKYHESKQRERVRRLIMNRTSCSWHTSTSLMPIEFLGQQYNSK